MLPMVQDSYLWREHNATFVGQGEKETNGDYHFHVNSGGHFSLFTLPLCSQRILVSDIINLLSSGSVTDWFYDTQKRSRAYQSPVPYLPFPSIFFVISSSPEDVMSCSINYVPVLSAIVSAASECCSTICVCCGADAWAVTPTLNPFGRRDKGEMYTESGVGDRVRLPPCKSYLL